MSQPNDDETYYADLGRIVPDWNVKTNNDKNIF